MGHIVTDPFVVQIPRVLVNKDGSPTFEYSEFLRYDNQFKHDIWQRVAGPTNNIDQTNVQVTEIQQEVNNIQNGVQLAYTPISTDRTTTGNELIVASNGVVITLNSSPSDYERVIVQTTVDSQVTIVGAINNSSQIIIHRAYDLIDLEYRSTPNRWFIK